MEGAPFSLQEALMVLFLVYFVNKLIMIKTDAGSGVDWFSPSCILSHIFVMLVKTAPLFWAAVLFMVLKMSFERVRVRGTTTISYCCC